MIIAALLEPNTYLIVQLLLLYLSTSKNVTKRYGLRTQILRNGRDRNQVFCGKVVDFVEDHIPNL